MMFVQFDSEKHLKIVAVLCAPQDPAHYPFQGEVPEDDPRYLIYTGADRASTEAALSASVDKAADDARSAVVGDPLLAVEYSRTAVQARAYADAGYKGEVPAMVAAWAIGGRTAQQAADDIITQANQFESALTQLRTIRLAAKEQIRVLFLSGASKDIAAAQAIAENTVATIQAAVTGLGYNA